MRELKKFFLAFASVAPMVRPITVASLCAPFTPELCEESHQSWSERGFSRLDTDLQNAFPEASVQEGFSIYGHEVRSGKAKVEKWVKAIRN